MQFNLSAEEIRPLIHEILQTAVEKLEADKAGLGDQLAYSESDAARLPGLNTQQLRDERIRGRIASTRIVGGQIRYSREDLLAYLRRNRSEASTGQLEALNGTKCGKS